MQCSLKALLERHTTSIHIAPPLTGNMARPAVSGVGHVLSFGSGDYHGMKSHEVDLLKGGT